MRGSSYNGKKLFIEYVSTIQYPVRYSVTASGIDHNKLWIAVNTVYAGKCGPCYANVVKGNQDDKWITISFIDEETRQEVKTVRYLKQKYRHLQILYQ